MTVWITNGTYAHIELSNANMNEEYWHCELSMSPNTNQKCALCTLWIVAGIVAKRVSFGPHKQPTKKTSAVFAEAGALHVRKKCCCRTSIHTQQGSLLVPLVPAATLRSNALCCATRWFGG